MYPGWRPPRDDGGERLRLAWALMLVQAACGLLATLGLLIFTLGFAPAPGMALLLGFNVAKNVALVALAAGVVRRRQAAIRWALVLEAASVLAGMASLVLDIVPGVYTGAGLSTLIISVGLPSTVVALLAGRPSPAAGRLSISAPMWRDGNALNYRALERTGPGTAPVSAGHMPGHRRT